MQKHYFFMPFAIKKTILLMVISAIAFYCKGQSYIGYHSSAYTGVYSILNNPADILNHRVRGDFNLVGISTGIGNNIVKFKYANRKDDNGGFSFPNPITKIGKFNFNTDVFGPSILVRLSDKNAIAITTRARVATNVYGLGTPMLNGLLQDTIASELINHVLNIHDMNANVHAWKEVAVTYSRQIANSDYGVWKMGASVKYLGGVAALSINTKNLQYTYDSIVDPADNKKKDALVNTQGSFALQYTKTLDSISGNDIISFKHPGIGLDIGVSYEYRDEMQVYETSYSDKTANYIWKVGASITDIGFINYNKQDMKSITTKFSGQSYFVDQLNVPSDSSDLYQMANYYKNLFNARTESAKISMQLPTTLHLTYDRYFNKWLGVQALVNVPLVFSKLSYYVGNYAPVSVYVTPRAEISWVGLYFPIGYNAISGMQAGFAMRLGPLVIGSSSIINTRMAKTKSSDAYFILRLPLFGYRPYKNRDNGQEQPKLTRRQRRLLDCPR